MWITEELDTAANKDTLPSGVYWMASRMDFVVKKYKSGATPDEPIRFHVKKRVPDILAEVDSKRRAAIECWKGDAEAMPDSNGSTAEDTQHETQTSQTHAADE